MTHSSHDYAIGTMGDKGETTVLGTQKPGNLPIHWMPLKCPGKCFARY
jgi:hypothetical protein